MAIIYGGDGDVSPAGLYQGVKGARLRLRCAIDDLRPFAADDEEALAAHEVAEEVLAYLEGLEGELDSWCNSKWPDVQIVEGVYTAAYRHCLLGKDEFKRAGYDQYRLLNALATVCLWEASLQRRNLREVVTKFEELMCHVPEVPGLSMEDLNAARPAAPASETKRGGA